MELKVNRPHFFVKAAKVARLFTSRLNGKVSRTMRTSNQNRSPNATCLLEYQSSLQVSQGTVKPEDCDLETLKARLSELPPTTSDMRGRRNGDPVNLVIIGDFSSVISVFASRWDQTEVISIGSCWRTLKSFLLGSEYRHSPVSALYLFQRPQDFALQRVRDSINERLHLRLWSTPFRFEGRAVWVGQVSRDIGIRFTWRTWHLTTHRIDPDVDKARDFVMGELFEAGRITAGGYFEGVGSCSEDAPSYNLTGDPYYTDGHRAVVWVSDERTMPRPLNWT